MKRASRFLTGLGSLAVAVGSQAAVATAAPKGGTLVLSGGINASFKLSPANCVAGPGDSLTINGLAGGGWTEIDFYVTDPILGHRGAAQVDLDGSGYRTAPYGVDDWIWTAKKNSGHISKPVRITQKGASGAIDLVLPLSDTFDAPKTTSVKVTLAWSQGTCKA